MKITILTLFPEIFLPVLNSSITGRAQKKGLVKFEIINIRDFAEGKRKMVDDKPYGGGVGMVLKADVLAKTLKSKGAKLNHLPGRKSVLMSASGKPYKQEDALRFSKLKHLIIICGHYEGVDERFIQKYVDLEISIGDYVLTGGEIPAMVITDSIIRLIPGVLSKEEATSKESFSDIRHPTSDIRLLEYPQYTRPDEFEGIKVPEVLLSGDHKKIDQWRKHQALEKTKKVRPDLLKRVHFPRSTEVEIDSGEGRYCGAFDNFVRTCIS